MTPTPAPPPDSTRGETELDLIVLTAQVLAERAAYIVEHTDSIGVRVRGSEGRWTNQFLADLPPDIAIREAFRLLLRAEVPHRKVAPAVKPRRGDSALTRGIWWCECGRGICDGEQILGYAERSVRWNFCPHCGRPLDWSAEDAARKADA